MGKERSTVCSNLLRRIHESEICTLSPKALRIHSMKMLSCSYVVFCNVGMGIDVLVYDDSHYLFDLTKVLEQFISDITNLKGKQLSLMHDSSCHRQP